MCEIWHNHGEKDKAMDVIMFQCISIHVGTFRVYVCVCVWGGGGGGGGGVFDFVNNAQQAAATPTGISFFILQWEKLNFI